MWHVYLLLCEDESIYTGTTNDVARRFEAHCAGKGGRYTRSHKPVKILYSEAVRTKSRALKREVEIKRWRRDKKLQLITNRDKKIQNKKEDD